MTDSRLSFTARAIILLLGLSLLVMLGVTIKERVSNPHLVTERPTDPQGMGQEQNLLASLMQKVAAEPTNKDALMHLAEHLMATQEWDAAATFAQRAVALDVNDPQPLYMLGVILHNQGKPQEAAATPGKGGGPAGRRHGALQPGRALQLLPAAEGQGARPLGGRPQGSEDLARDAAGHRRRTEKINFPRQNKKGALGRPFFMPCPAGRQVAFKGKFPTSQPLPAVPSSLSRSIPDKRPSPSFSVLSRRT